MPAASTRRVVAGGALATLALCAAVAAAVYAAAPVDDLRGTIVYQPADSETTRAAGLGAPNVALADLPDTLLLALLWNEDKKFPDHHGFDLEELGTSVREWLSGDRRLRGASTLTQQLARTLFLDRRRTLLRKLVEAIYTVKLERRLSKDEILLLYVNNVEWSPGVYGIGAAASHYFDKAPSALTPGECVFLVAILPDPPRLAAGFREGRLPRGTLIRVQRLTTALHGAIPAGTTPAMASDAVPPSHAAVASNAAATHLVAAVKRLKAHAGARRPAS